jgi:hypothetical protein
MRRLYVLAFLIAFVCQYSAFAGEYRLAAGDIIRGEPVSYNEEGVVFRLDIGGFSPRVSWSRFSQESLRELSQNPQARPLAEPFIEILPEEREQERKKREIVVRPVESRIERPAVGGILEAFSTPAGLILLGLLYLANLYAAYEIAVYRNRPVALVVGLSVILPVLAPILFLALPTASDVAVEEYSGAVAAHPEPAAVAAAPTPAAGGGLGLASMEKAASGGTAEGAVYKRGEFTFNRRFVETKFSGFFRVVPSEAERDLVMVVRAAKNEYLAKRVSRISMTEMHLQLVRGGSEVSVPFSEIIEMQVRHKDKAA